MQGLAVGAVPDAQDAVVATGDDDLLVRRDIDTVQEINGAAEVAIVATVVGTVQPDKLVTARGSNVEGVTDKPNVGYLFAKAFDSPLLIGRDGVPNLDRLVSAGTGQHLAVTLPRHAQHVMCVTFESPQLLEIGRAHV